MTATVSDFRAKFPELAAGDPPTDATIQLFLDEAALVVNLSACPNLADLIQLNYAAHEFAKSGHNPEGQNTNVGAVTSTTVGQISQSVQVSDNGGSGSADYFKSTIYGTKYLTLVRKCFGGSITVVP